MPDSKRSSDSWEQKWKQKVREDYLTEDPWEKHLQITESWEELINHYHQDIGRMLRSVVKGLPTAEAREVAKKLLDTIHEALPEIAEGDASSVRAYLHWAFFLGVIAFGRATEPKSAKSRRRSAAPRPHRLRPRGEPAITPKLKTL